MKRNNALGAFASVVVLLSVAACGSTGSKVDQGTLDGYEATQAQLAAREAELNRKAEMLAAQEANMKNQSSVMPTGGSLLPPGAKAGECYTRIWQGPSYSTKTERKLISEAGERLEVIPAKYGKVTKRVMIEEASSKLITVPATYRTVSEQVLVQPARTETTTIPPVYETVTERVLDKPAHTTWKKGTGPIQRIDSSTGEIMCLVEVPATYRTISKQVLKTPASTRTRDIPAVYKTVKKRVVDTPATTKTVEIPAKYGTVTVTEEVTPASTRRIPIPAKYTNVTHTEIATEGQMAWREILCETNTTPQRVRQIQSALSKAGFNPGPADGNIGPSTIRAVNAFQRSKGLPVEKYLTVDTVRALGVATR